MVKKRASKQQPENPDYLDNPPGLILTKATLDHLLKQPKPDQLLALYTFYCYTALWQGTSQIWATTEYAAQGMGWSKGKLQQVKKRLVDLGYVEDVQLRISGHFGKRFIRVRYRPTPPSKSEPRVNTVRRKNDCTVKTAPKCLSTGNSKCLSSGRWSCKQDHVGRNDLRVGGLGFSGGGDTKKTVKHTTFALRWGAKIQQTLKLHGYYHYKGERHNKPVAPSTWARQIEYILHKMRINQDTFKSIMSWYLSEGVKQPKVPRIFRVTHLVDKWPSLRDAYDRMTKAPDSGIRYRRGADGEYGYYDDSVVGV